MRDHAPFVLLTTDYPPQRGGVARYLSALVEGSSGQMRVIVPEELRATGDQVERKHLFWSVWPRWWPMVRVCRELGADPCTLVVSQILPVGTAARIARMFGGAPYVVICHGMDVRLAERSSWKRSLARWILRGATRVIANSHSTSDVVTRISGIVPGIVYPGGVRTDLPDRGTARTRLGVGSEEHVILSVARLVERKGIDHLISAVGMLPTADQVRLVVIGDGPELKLLQSAAQGSPHRIDFFTDASDACAAEWYAASDVFCLPARESSTDVEGFGIVFIEAASAGLPVIAGKTGGVSEAVVDGETGLLIDPTDTRELARTLLRVLGDADLRKRLGDAGRMRALRDFRWETRWSQLIAVLASGEMRIHQK